MVRVVDAVEGLALGGVATVGPTSWRVPALLEPEVPGAPTGAGGPSVTSLPASASGERRFALTVAGDRIEFTVPTGAPEVSGVRGSATAVAPRIWAVHWPVPDDRWEEMGRNRPELVVLSNARALFADGEPFVEALFGLRDRLGGRPVIWAPRVALPHRLAALVYLGVEVLDTTEGAWRAARGARFDPTLGETAGSDRGSAAREDDRAAGGSPVGTAYATEIELVRRALGTGRLRELVEARLTAEPALAELLRRADRRLAPLLDDRAPVVGTETRTYVLRESHRRPEVVRFVERFLDRYRPPPSKRVLVLLPCSRTKPYRVSPSHRRFARALEGLERVERLHIVSVTSPLGVVPRELEDVYPARHYDIPVTGEWDELERARVVRAVGHLLATGAYESAIVHLDPAEYAFLRDAWPGPHPATWTADDHRTGAPDALDRLRRAAESALGGSSPVAGGPLTVVREGLREVAAVQFGRPGADALFGGSPRLAGRPWFQRLTDGQGTDLATYREERGLFQLTVAGGTRMDPSHAVEVEIGDGVDLRGDLFVPGVVRADPSIRAGDAVRLVRGGRLVAVGEAELSGRLMAELDRGRAVEVRHRVAGAVGASASPEPANLPSPELG